MKKRGKAKLIALLICLMSLLLLGACSGNLTTAEVLQNNNLTATVVYYANGGTFNGGRNVKEMYYKANSPIFNLGIGTTVGTSSLKIERSNYDLLGWYYVELDGEGNPVFQDEEKSIPVLTDTEVDFSERIEKDEKWYIGARWQARVKLFVQLVCDEGVEIVDKASNTTYKNGDTLKTFSYDAGTNAVQAFTEIKDEQGGQVFVEYYNEPECKLPVDFPVKQLDDQQTDRVIYAKYIDSSWTVVKNASDFAEMWDNPIAGKKYWIARDIDLDKTTLSPMESFACEVQGNGYTVESLQIEKKEIGRDITLSMFGNIASTAVMKNLSFVDVKVEYALTMAASPETTEMYFIFTSVATGADIENVTFDGTGTRFTVRRNRNSLFLDDFIVASACLYGGFASDVEYTNENPEGFKIMFDVENFIRIY